MRWKGLNAWLNTLMIVTLMTVTGFSYNAAVAWQHRLSDRQAAEVLDSKVLKPVKETDAETADHIRFVAIGDTGSRLPGQYQTAKALINSYDDKPFGFVLMLGDNIYPKGDVRQFGEASFTQPYGPLLKAQVPFYVSLGNHDVLFGFKQDQIAFFKMPASYYVVKRGIADFFAIDTNDFDLKQQQWLYDQLQASKAPWKIVFGHHPVWSSGKHGNNRSLMATLVPILKEQHVPLYLAGHDHHYERFKPRHGVTYVVSGGGGAVLRPLGQTQPGSAAQGVVHHFIRFEATPKKLSAEVVASDSSMVDRFTLKQ